MNEIKTKTYTIYFGENGYLQLNNFIREKDYSSIFILVDDNTLECCYNRFIQLLETTSPIEVIQILPGEIHKNLETCQGVWQVMTELGADRKSLLITLGGGVITDLGGFTAATFKRGIDFINIPTTLLAMVDASVGGKTGVDLGNLKNQIGLFVNPEMVIIDPEYLYTLSPREIRSGSAEILKYGLIYDKNLYTEIKNNDNLNIINLIYRSVEIKNEIVNQDPKEQGIRKVLNFGHTIGHAIESYFLSNENKEYLTHGEAIAIGMICEAYISCKTLCFPEELTHEIKDTITKVFGRIEINKTDFLHIIELLKHDKKNTNGNINFVLLNDIENYSLNNNINQELIINSLNYYNDSI